VSSDREIIDVAKAQGAFVMKAQEFVGKLQGPLSLTRTTPHKELDTEDNRPKRGLDKKGNPRKLPKSQRQRSRQLKRF
jgi:uncharacterized protein